MRPTTLRRLEALEEEDRFREQRARRSCGQALIYIWTVVLGYHLGGLKSGECPFKAQERALNYKSKPGYSEAPWKVINYSDPEAVSKLFDQFNDAYRRLFAKIGLDFDNTPRNVLFDAFVKMVNELPDEWLNWLASELRQWCPYAEIAVGSNLPRRLSPDNAFPFAREPMCHQNSSAKR
jgi:hypothetical protein